VISIYYLFTMLTGSLFAIMIVVNGRLGIFIGLYLSCVVIHLVGLVGSSFILTAKKQVPFKHPKVPLKYYSGGLFGIVTVLLFNTAYGQISVTALVALGLLGQAVSSLFVDQFGLFEMKKRPLNKKQIPGLIVAAVGIALMLRGFSAESVLPVILALLTGVTVVTSRTINGALGKRSTASLSAWYNHLVGLFGSVVVLAILGFPGSIPFDHINLSNAWIFTGGMLGVLAVTFSNFLIHHVSSYSMTLLLFVGQITGGVLLDVFLEGSFAPIQVLAGLIIVVGFSLNAYMTRPPIE
jgi:bacterial/archaeal transporter family-2 protein